MMLNGTAIPEGGSGRLPTNFVGQIAYKFQTARFQVAIDLDTEILTLNERQITLDLLSDLIELARDAQRKQYDPEATPKALP